MAAVGLALISAVLFGGMSVGLRLGLNRRPDAALATIATVVGATAVAFVAAIAEAPSRGVHAGAAWVFLLAGLLQPGVGQILVTLAVREAGASRASIVFGVAPLDLGHARVAPARRAFALAARRRCDADRGRGRRARTRADAPAALARDRASLRVPRDDPLLPARQPAALVVRGHRGATRTAAAAALIGGLVVVALALGPRVRRLEGVWPFLGVGILFGLSYVSLFEAYYRGRVTVVSPLIATESLWGVALAFVVIGRSELVGRRVVIGAALVVVGGALIGVFR